MSFSSRVAVALGATMIEEMLSLSIVARETRLACDGYRLDAVTC